MTKIIAKLFAVAVVLTAFVHVGPLHASPFAFVATGGSGVTCGSTTPCASIAEALTVVDGGGEIFCLDSTVYLSGGSAYSSSVTIDCPGVFLLVDNESAALTLTGNQAVTIRNLTIRSENGAFPAVEVIGSGTLILENCVFERMNGTALDIEPTGLLNLVIRNSRISNGSSVGVILKPAAGGSINATFDRVTVTKNSAAGIRLDATNGPVAVDLTDSEISNNGGNGFGVTSGAGQGVVSITRSVIAKNGGVGVAANGATAGVMIDATLLDSNSTATSAASGGHILTYGNNRIVGPAGSGFTGPAPLQ